VRTSELFAVPVQACPRHRRHLASLIMGDLTWKHSTLHRLPCFSSCTPKNCADAHEVNGRAGLLQHQGEFPAPLEHEFRISEDATRYYQSGRSFLYRNLPFWMATLVSRLVVVLVPLMVVLIPGLRILPSVYRWRIRSRITKWYGALLELERGLLKANDPAAQAEMLKRLDEIDHSVKRMKVPKMFGDQFYVLRQHITLVRERLRENTQ